MEQNRITMLGTGNALVTRCYADIHDLFVTHAHTDHLLGCVWMMRMALQFGHPLRVWSHEKVLTLLTDICHAIRGYQPVVM